MSAAPFSGWASPELARLHHLAEQARDGLSGTAAGCLSAAMVEIELADEYVAKRIREEEE